MFESFHQEVSFVPQLPPAQHAVLLSERLRVIIFRLFERGFHAFAELNQVSLGVHGSGKREGEGVEGRVESLEEGVRWLGQHTL